MKTRGSQRVPTHSNDTETIAIKPDKTPLGRNLDQETSCQTDGHRSTRAASATSSTSSKPPSSKPSFNEKTSEEDEDTVGSEESSTSDDDNSVGSKATSTKPSNKRVKPVKEARKKPKIVVVPGVGSQFLCPIEDCPNPGPHTNREALYRHTHNYHTKKVKFRFSGQWHELERDGPNGLLKCPCNQYSTSKKATFLIHVSKCPAERPLSASLPPPNPEPDRPEPIKRKQSISSTSSRSQIQEPRRSQSPPPPPSSPSPKHEHTKEPSTSDPPPPTKWTSLIRETHPSFSFNMNAKHRRLQKRVKEFAESHQLGKCLEIPRELKDEFMAFISEELGDCLDEKCEVKEGKGCEKGGEEDNVEGTRGAVKAETPDLASAAECVFSEDSKEEGKPDVKVDESKLLDSDKIITEIMPDYRTFPQELKDAVQTGVKFFLQEEGEAVNPIETFHMVPTRLEDSFREWAFLELTRCFPASVVLRK